MPAPRRARRLPPPLQAGPPGRPPPPWALPNLSPPPLWASGRGRGEGGARGVAGQPRDEIDTSERGRRGAERVFVSVGEMELRNWRVLFHWRRGGCAGPRAGPEGVPWPRLGGRGEPGVPPGDAAAAARPGEEGKGPAGGGRAAAPQLSGRRQLEEGGGRSLPPPFAQGRGGGGQAGGPLRACKDEQEASGSLGGGREVTPEWLAKKEAATRGGRQWGSPPSRDWEASWRGE